MSENKMTQEEQLEAIMEQLQNRIDARDFMTPTQREIAELSIEQLETEYQEVQKKESKRGRAQRDYIVSRYEFEQEKKKKEDEQVDVDK